MKLYEYKTRDEYIQNQIERSREKSQYCKVFFGDVIRYKELLLADKKTDAFNDRGNRGLNPILCLGVRSGAEVDIFRAVFLGPLLKTRWVQRLAVRLDRDTEGYKKIKLAHWLGIGSGGTRDGRVVGVELAPEAERADIWIGSYDELPAGWRGRFGLIYSNSIDHSQDPEKTVAEWKRVAAPGAYALLAFTPGKKVSSHDPFGGFGLDEMKTLWNEPVVFSNAADNFVGYSEICFRLKG
ncbi:MAG TPA: hypothetical protein VIH42_13980 [Thermoguttaceae bacterium]